MKTKKKDVIFRIGLLTVLINAVSSELFISTEALKYIPNYRKMKGQNGEGKLLKYNLINPGTTVKLSYDIDVDENKLLKGIRFDVVSAVGETPPVGTVIGASRQCGGLPGIKAFPQQCTPKNLWKWKWIPPSQEYCYKGMYITFKAQWYFWHQLMKLIVMFHDNEKGNSIGVYMIMFEKPTTQEDIRLMKIHNAFASDALIPIEELAKLTDITRKKSEGNIHMAHDMSWMRDVLDRAKFSTVKMLDNKHTDWYYAGALMVNPAIFPMIPQLDNSWERFIRKGDED